MDQETMALTQKERDRLDLLKQAQRKQITQRKAAEQMQVSERWVRQLLKRMKTEKDRGWYQAAGPALQPTAERRRARSDCDDPPSAGVCGIRSHARSRASGAEASPPGRARSLAPAHAPSRIVACAEPQTRSHSRVAPAAQPVWRTGAMGQFHPRLAGRAWPATEADP